MYTDTKKLEMLKAVASLGSISKAAEKMGYSQPGLTGMLNRLEDEVGFALLERGSNGVVLTARGRELMPVIDRVLESGPIPGWADPQALRQAAHDPTLDDVSRARALSALEARLQAHDPILGQMWREASIEALAGRRSVAETLAEIQARMKS